MERLERRTTHAAKISAPQTHEHASRYDRAISAELVAVCSRPDVIHVETVDATRAGDWIVRVVRTATSARFITTALRADEALGRGEVVITTARGRSVTVEVDAAMTLAALKQRINHAPIGARASLVRSGDVVILTVTAAESGLGAQGEDLQVVAAMESGDAPLSFRRQRAGQRACVEVDGSRRWSNTNTFKGAIPGATMTVQRGFEGLVRVALEPVAFDDLSAASPALDNAERGELERLRAERDALHAELWELRRERDQAVGALENAAVAIAVTDARGRIAYANPAYVAMTEQRRGEIITTSTAAAITPGASSASDLVIAEHERCLRTLTRPIERDGRIEGAVTTCTDVTDLVASGRERDELVTLLTHEFQTPLTSIKGFTELMLDRSYPVEQQRQFQAIVRQEATRMGDLMTDVLALQRLANGSDGVNPQPADPGALVFELFQTLKPYATQHTLTLHADASLPDVLVDEEALAIIMTHLVSNAVRYSDVGSRVHVAVTAQPGAVALEVRDEGIGIEAAALPRIFDRFYRGPGPERDEVSGSGLGLAVVKRYADLMGARVEVESERGAGSTFKVVFAAPELRAAA